MPELIDDRKVAVVLRPFVRATAPVLAALRESDPLGLVRRVLPAAHTLADGADQDARDLHTVERSLRERMADGLESVKVPGTAAWARMSVEERDDWWCNRVGRFVVLLASIPGVGGALADRLPVQDTLAIAGQALVLCAIAEEHGVTGVGDRVRLLAAVLFKRDIDPSVVAGVLDQAGEDRATAELTEELTESTAAHGRFTVRAVARTLWRFGRTLWALGDELDKRPQGRFYHRMLGALPLVGIAGDYLGERSALRRAGKAGAKWIEKET